MKLQDRVAIVTGAAQGIGKAVADKLAAEGAKVVAVDVNGEGAERTAAGVDGTAVQADISSPEDVQRMVDETVSRHGKVDVLANVAAILRAAGSDLSRLLKVTVYISDMDMWGAVNQVYARVLGDHRPARAIVPVKELHYGFQIEIEAIAALNE